MEALKEKLKHIYILGKHADTDWRRLFSASVVLVVLLMVWSGLFFANIKSTSESTNLDISQPKVLSGRTKGDDLKELVERYEQRAAVFNKILGTPATKPAPIATSSASTTVSQKQ